MFALVQSHLFLFLCELISLSSAIIDTITRILHQTLIKGSFMCVNKGLTPLLRHVISYPPP